MSRTDARELLMKLLFQMEAQQDFSVEAREHFFSNHPKDVKQEDYLTEMAMAIFDNLPEIDKMIEDASENWKISRMGKVDLAVIRLAVIEIFYMKEIPDSVSINEAVDIAKKYGTEESGKFVNGILGRVIKMKNAKE